MSSKIKTSRLAAQLTDDDRLLATEETCYRLGLTRRQLRSQIERGKIEPVKVGRENRFRAADVKAIIEHGLN